MCYKLPKFPIPVSKIGLLTLLLPLMVLLELRKAILPVTGLSTSKDYCFPTFFWPCAYSFCPLQEGCRLYLRNVKHIKPSMFSITAKNFSFNFFKRPRIREFFCPRKIEIRFCLCLSRDLLVGLCY